MKNNNLTPMSNVFISSVTAFVNECVIKRDALEVFEPKAKAKAPSSVTNTSTNSTVFKKFSKEDLKAEMSTKWHVEKLPSASMSLQEVLSLFEDETKGLREAFVQAFPHLKGQLNEVLPEVYDEYQQGYKLENELWQLVDKEMEKRDAGHNEINATNSCIAAVVYVEIMARLMRGSYLPRNQQGKALDASIPTTVGTDNHANWWYQSTEDKLLSNQVFQSWKEQEDILNISIQEMLVNIDYGFDEENNPTFYQDYSPDKKESAPKCKIELADSDFLKHYPNLYLEQPKLAMSLFSVKAATKNKDRQFLCWSGIKEDVIKYFKGTTPSNIFFTDFWSHSQSFMWDISYDEMRGMLVPLAASCKKKDEQVMSIEDHEPTEEDGRSFTVWFEQQGFLITEKHRMVYEEPRGRYIEGVVLTSPLVNNSPFANPSQVGTFSEADCGFLTPYGVFMDQLMSAFSHMRVGESYFSSEATARQFISQSKFFSAGNEIGSSIVGERGLYNKNVFPCLHSPTTNVGGVLLPKFRVEANAGASPLTDKGDGQGCRSFTWVKPDYVNSMMDIPVYRKFNLVRMHKGSMHFVDGRFFHTPFKSWDDPVQAFLNVVDNIRKDKFIPGKEVSVAAVLYEYFKIACDNEEEAELTVEIITASHDKKLGKVTKRESLNLAVTAKICDKAQYILSYLLGRRKALVFNHNDDFGQGEAFNYKSLIVKSIAAPGQSWFTSSMSNYDKHFMVPQTFKSTLDGWRIDKDGKPQINFLAGVTPVMTEEEVKDSILAEKAVVQWSYTWDEEITIYDDNGLEVTQATGFYAKAHSLVAKIEYWRDGVLCSNDVFIGKDDLVVTDIIFKADKSGDNIYGMSVTVKGYRIETVAKLRGEFKTIPVVAPNNDLVYNDLNPDLIHGVEWVSSLDAWKSHSNIRGLMATFAQTAAHTKQGRDILRKLNKELFDVESSLSLIWDEKAALTGQYDELEQFILDNYSSQVWVKNICPHNGTFSNIFLPMYEDFADKKDDWYKLKDEDRNQLPEFADGQFSDKAHIFVNGENLETANILIVDFDEEYEILFQRTAALAGNEKMGHLYVPHQIELSAISQVLSESKVLSNVAVTVETGVANSIKPNPELAHWLMEDGMANPKRWSAFKAMLDCAKFSTVNSNGDKVVLPECSLITYNEQGDAEINRELVKALRKFDDGRLIGLAKTGNLTLEDLSTVLSQQVIRIEYTKAGDEFSVHLPTLFQQESEPTDDRTFAGVILTVFEHLIITDKKAVEHVRQAAIRARGSLSKLVVSPNLQKTRGKVGVYAKIAASYMCPINEQWVLYSENPNSYYQRLVKVAAIHGIPESKVDGMKLIFSRMPLPFSGGQTVRLIYSGEFTSKYKEEMIDKHDGDMLIDHEDSNIIQAEMSEEIEPLLRGKTTEQIAVQEDKRLTYLELIVGKSLEIMNIYQPLMNPMAVNVDAGDVDGDDRLSVPVPEDIYVEQLTFEVILKITEQRIGKNPISANAEGYYICDHYNVTEGGKDFGHGIGKKHLSIMSDNNSLLKALYTSYKGSHEELQKAIKELEGTANEFLYNSATYVQGTAVGEAHKFANVSFFAWAVFLTLSDKEKKTFKEEYSFFFAKNWNLVGFEVYENPLGGFSWEIYFICKILADGGCFPKRKGKKNVSISDFFDLKYLLEEAGLNSSELNAINDAAAYVASSPCDAKSDFKDTSNFVKTAASLLFRIEKGQLDIDTEIDIDSEGVPIFYWTPTKQAFWFLLSFKEHHTHLYDKSLVVKLVYDWITTTLSATNHKNLGSYLMRKGLLEKGLELGRPCSTPSVVVDIPQNTKKHKTIEVSPRREVFEDVSLEAYHTFLLCELKAKLKDTKFGLQDNYVTTINDYVSPIVSKLSEDQCAAVHKFFFGKKEIPLFMLSGAGGTGKSHVTGAIVEILRHCTQAHVVLAASSGTAAKNLSPEAITFGSLSGQGVKQIAPLEVNSTSHYNATSLVKKMQKRVGLSRNSGRHVVMIIDEVSMLSAEQLHVFMETARLAYNANFNVTSGEHTEKYGFTSMFVGDMPQLQPVEGKPAYQDSKFIIDGKEYNHTSIFDEYGINLAGLYINHRVQGENSKFAQELIDISEGTSKVTSDSVIGQQVVDSNAEVKGTGLFSSNAEAKAFNKKVAQEFNIKGAKSKTYALEVFLKGKWWTVEDLDRVLSKATLTSNDGSNKWQGKQAYQSIENLLPPWVEIDMTLFEGMKYMFRENDKERGLWANGSVGIVKEVHDEYIVVELNGEDLVVKPQISISKIYSGGKLVASFRGLLGHPAHAITVQKAQGLTIKEGDVNIFINNPKLMAQSPGLVYTALSRVATPEQLKIHGGLASLNKAISVDEKAVNFRKEGEQVLKEYVDSLDYSSLVKVFNPESIERFDLGYDEDDASYFFMLSQSEDVYTQISYEEENDQPFTIAISEDDECDSFSFSTLEELKNYVTETCCIDEDELADVCSFTDWFFSKDKKVISIRSSEYQTMTSPCVASYVNNEVKDNFNILTQEVEPSVKIEDKGHAVTLTNNNGETQTLTWSLLSNYNWATISEKKYKFDQEFLFEAFKTAFVEPIDTSVYSEGTHSFVVKLIGEENPKLKDGTHFYSTADLANTLSDMSDEELESLFEELKSDKTLSLWFFRA